MCVLSTVWPTFTICFLKSYFMSMPLNSARLCYSLRHLHRLGGSGSGCRPAGGDLADTRSWAALQLLPAQTRPEHQEGAAPRTGPLPVPLRPLKVVRVTDLWRPVNLPGGFEQGESPAVACWGAGLLLQPPDLQGLQAGGGLVHRLLSKREILLGLDLSHTALFESILNLWE